MKIGKDDLNYRKLQIIHCAFELFCEKGIDGVTMKEISLAAHVGVASVFRYFNTKAGLLKETQKLLWEEAQHNISSTTRTEEYRHKNGYERLKIFLDAFETFYLEHSEYILFAAQYRIYLIRNNLRLDEKEYTQMLVPTSGVLYRAIQKGLEDGSIAVSGDFEDIFYTTWGVMRGFVEEIVVYDKMLDGKNHWKERFQFVRAMILKALSADAQIDVFCGSKNGTGGDL